MPHIFWVLISSPRSTLIRDSTLSRSPPASPSITPAASASGSQSQKEKVGKKTSVTSVGGRGSKRGSTSPAPSESHPHVHLLIAVHTCVSVVPMCTIHAKLGARVLQIRLSMGTLLH